ncbi:MAG: hypothetical protein IPG54_11180 [Sphingomonadales bacterium]|nr:hypothetical protein [Sphingomonadales bacterium]
MIRRSAGLTVAMVNDWIANKIHEARADHLAICSQNGRRSPMANIIGNVAHPDKKGPGRPRRKVGEIWIPLTAEMSAQFISGNGARQCRF